MTLKERLAAEPSDLGKALKTWVAYGIMGLDIVASLADEVSSAPDIAPHWLKVTIFFAGLLSRMLGNLTVKISNESPNKS